MRQVRQTHVPISLSRERDPARFVQETGLAPEPDWRCAENLAPLGSDYRTVQTIASRYTDSTIPPHTLRNYIITLYSVHWNCFTEFPVISGKILALGLCNLSLYRVSIWFTDKSNEASRAKSHLRCTKRNPKFAYCVNQHSHVGLITSRP